MDFTRIFCAELDTIKQDSQRNSFKKTLQMHRFYFTESIMI